ncbi:dicer 2-1 [Octopus vulgaris]|uniref:Dicer 2-1 n=1 Tax=Octopus vulgaris TaxID=6645 RepID=A0AA36ARV8_OCTVU|nr:dicer 2-1 [Octopus vulgaris]
MSSTMGTLGRCDLCIVQYTSKEHKESHLLGKKHKKKLSDRERFCTSLPIQEVEPASYVQQVYPSLPNVLVSNVSPCNTEAVTEPARSQTVSVNVQTTQTCEEDENTRQAEVIPNIVSVQPTSLDHNEFIRVYKDEVGEIIGYKCILCSKKLQCLSAVTSHLQSSAHSKNVSEQPSKLYNLPPIVRHCEDPVDEAYCLTDSIPRGYQAELFEKSHCYDSVIFLPTGTGKTLISIMVISHMLKRNPRRPVLFIVDKVLLALQQFHYIQNELKDQKFSRFDTTNIENIIERNLKIICVYGGHPGSAKDPLSLYDVIISTAVYCDRRMKEKVLRWKDFSLVVIDEVHHSDKEHPFRKLLGEEHHTLEKKDCPQLLGLTASPAGKETISKTITMLQTLVTNLNNSKINIVKEETKELMKYKSTAHLEIQTIPFQDAELPYIAEFKKYLLECLKVLVDCSDLSRNIIPSNEDLIDKSFLNEIEERLRSVTITGEMEKGTIVINHTKKIVSLIIDALDGGISCIVEELKFLSDPSNKEYSFTLASGNGLCCDNIRSIVNTIVGNNIPVSAQFKYLVKTIGEYMTDNCDIPSGLILVMVKRRRTAVELGKMMKTSPLVNEKHLSVVSITGHGGGGGDGMRVSTQRKVFQEIKEGKHQIIITTSVAEEGVDLPKCSLVITLNPPTSVVTLVQMRGRARKNNSTFLVVCENAKNEENIRNLLGAEKIMEEATEYMCNKERSP